MGYCRFVIPSYLTSTVINKRYCYLAEASQTMSSRNLLNLVLLIVIIGLIAVVVYEPGIEPEVSNPPLTSLKQDDISHIFIQRESDDIELQKIDGIWQLVKPYPVPAHDFRVQTILRLSEAESHSQNILSNLNKATYGLHQPKVSVTFNKNVKIQFGINEPLQQMRYVQTADTLHTIVDSFFYQVSSQVSTFIDHQLLAGITNISRLELPELVVELKQGKWQLTPQPEKYSADSITELLNNWRTVQAVEIAKANNITSKQTVKIFTAKDDKPLVFTVVKNEQGIALIRNDLGLAYSINQDSYEKLFKLPESTNKQESQ